MADQGAGQVSEPEETPIIIPTNAKVLIVGDSFVRRAEDILRKLYPSLNLMVVALGQQTPDILELYYSCLPRINRFGPTHVILHEGHNQMAKDKHRNPVAMISRDVADYTLKFALIIKRHYPLARVFISAMLPRTFSHRVAFTRSDVMAFNTRAKRHGQRVRTLAGRNGLECVINNFVWRTITTSTEESDYYENDGIHLDAGGMKMQTREWLTEIFRPIKPVPKEKNQ